MFTRFVSFLVIFCTALFGLTAPAAQADILTIPCSDGGSFEISGSEVTSSTPDCAGEISIPAEVTRVAFAVFAGKDQITSVIFETGSQLVVLSAYAFAGTGLTSVVLPSLLERIENGVFASTRLSSLSVPGTVWNISGEAFASTLIESVVFQPRVASILSLESNTFTRSPVSSVTFLSSELASQPFAMDKGNHNFAGWSRSAGGPLVSYPLAAEGTDGITLFPNWTLKVRQTISCSLGGSFTIVDNVGEGNPTDDCAGEIVIPATVQSLPFAFFAGKSQITSAVFEEPSQLTLIPNWLFAGAGLESVQIPSSVTQISYAAFASTKLTSISIPRNVSRIDNEVFRETPLETVTFEDREGAALSLGEDIFFGTQLSSVIFESKAELAESPFIPNKDAHTWLGWSTILDGSVASFPVSAGSSNDIILYPTWSPKIWNATYDSNGGTSVSPGLVVGGVIQFPVAPTREGFSFRGWSNEILGSLVTRWTQDSDVTFYAQWAEATATRYSVTFDILGGSWTDIANSGGTPVASFTGSQPVYGTGPFTPVRDGYTFDGWATTEGGTSITFPYSPGVTEDITLYALWISDVVFREVSFESNGGSDVEAATFAQGGDIESAPSASTRAGYAFAGWSATDGGTAITFPYTPGVKEDITLYARWTPNTYTVTLNPKGGSNVAAVSFVTGGQIALAPAMSARAGYTFAGWSATDGGSVIRFPYSPGVINNITLYAKWSVKNVKASATVKPTIRGTAKLKATLTAIPGSWTGYPTPKVAYQWYSCTKAVTGAIPSIPSTCKAIAGKTATTLALVTSYRGKFIAARVTGTSAGTTPTFWLSKSTTAVK